MSSMTQHQAPKATGHTPTPWHYGGPVKRESLLKRLNGSDQPNGVSARVYEIGQEGDTTPPGIAVVNDYFNGVDRFTAKANAAYIVLSANHFEEAVAALRALAEEQTPCSQGFLCTPDTWRQRDTVRATRAILAKIDAQEGQ